MPLRKPFPNKGLKPLAMFGIVKVSNIIMEADFVSDNIVYKYKFGTIGRKEVVFDGKHLSINANAMELQDIKCVYVKYPTDWQNGTIYFSMDGKDIGAAAAINKNAFMYIKSQQKNVNELLNGLGLDVLDAEEVLKSNGTKSKVPNKENKGIIHKTLEENRQKKERLKRMDKEGIPYCPKCKSTSLQYVERRKQLSIGRGVAGSVIGGIVGAPLAGAVGAVTSKKYKGRIKCLNCGKSWKK